VRVLLDQVPPPRLERVDRLGALDRARELVSSSGLISRAWARTPDVASSSLT
jgi:hypothetical protein